jgi:hypothetical protein
MTTVNVCADRYGIACCVLSVILTVTAGSARADAIRCPDRLGHHRFDIADITDGPPDEAAFLLPVRGGWDVSGGGALSPAGLYLVCRYRDTKETREIHLPATVKYCILDISNKTVVNVTCR